jgi:hypothetical protein
MTANISLNLPTGRQAKLRLLSYSTCKMNVLFFSSSHFAKIIKALLYAKKFLTGYVDYIERHFLEKEKPL